MPKVLLKDVTAGMVLAADTTNHNGMVLLKQGVAISERHINVLKTWGVTHIEIEGSGHETPIQELIAAHPELLEEANQRAAIQFSHVDDKHPLFEALIPLWKQHYVLKRIKKQP